MSSKTQNIKPPRLAKWLLQSFCSYDYLSTALWDLEELFQYNVETKGQRKAKWIYFKESLSIISHLYFKGHSQYSLNTTAMLKNNIIIALRNFKKHKNYTLLNIIGLSSGLMIFLLITLFTSYEFSYDKYHEASDRIYRVYKSFDTRDGLYTDSGTPGPLANALTSEFPEVEAAARFSKWRNQLMVANGNSFLEPALHAVDPSVFNIFSFELLDGSKDKLLSYGPNIAISETTAQKYFGKTEVVNETMKLDGEMPFTVTAVFKDMPENSHFKMNIIAHFEWAQNTFNQNLTNWNNNPYYTYIKLKEGTDASSLEAKLPQIRAKFADDPIDEDGQMYDYYLQPLEEVHFSKDILGSMGEYADAQRLQIFNLIAIIVLVMASINYVNLATARAMVRVRETGIRKILGAKKYSLLSQFLIESGFLVFLSLAAAIVLANLLIPAFSYFIDRPLDFALDSPLFWLQILGLGFVLTLASGLYPAFLMSSFNPLWAIRSKTGKTSSNYLRNGLVVLQFGLSAILIFSALVLKEQLSFIDNVDTGYTRDNIMILSTRDDAIDDNLNTYMDQLFQVSGVDAVATSWSLPTNVTSNAQANWPGITDAERIQMFMLGVTHGFFDLYEIDFIEGRAFDREIKTDRSAIILNEAAVKAFGWDDPIGREMIRQNGRKATVIGVVKDFNIKSLKQEIEPLQIVLNPNYARLAIKLSGDVSSTMAQVEEVYESFSPAYPFEYTYFEDIYDRAYTDDTKTGQLTLIFSVLAIVIACLGLYGLASHKVALRIKELGVRKVMGASAIQIAKLLFKDFATLITIAFLITGPIAYLMMNSWLEDYAFHISLGVLPFVLTLILLFVFASITVGFRTYKASISNPVLALRDE